MVIFPCSSIYSLLLTKGNECLFVDLLPIYFSGQHVLKSFVHVLIGLFALLFLNCRSSLCILNTSPLQMYRYMVCDYFLLVFGLPVLFMVSFDGQKF